MSLDAAGFDDMDDAEKVKFSQEESAATLARLDKLSPIWTV